MTRRWIIAAPGRGQIIPLSWARKVEAESVIPVPQALVANPFPYERAEAGAVTEAGQGRHEQRGNHR